MTVKIIVIAIDVREGARESLVVVYGANYIYNLNLCEIN
jgi:hypothetical protein